MAASGRDTNADDGSAVTFTVSVNVPSSSATSRLVTPRSESARRAALKPSSDAATVTLPPGRPANWYCPFPSDVVEDRKSTRLNSSHANISYAVFCLKKKKKKKIVNASNYNKKKNKLKHQ